MTFLGVFDRIANRVDDNLLQILSRAFNVLRQIKVVEPEKAQAFFLSIRLAYPDAGEQNLFQLEIRKPHSADATSIRRRHVEHPIHKVEQVLPGITDHADLLQLHVAFIGPLFKILAKEVRHTDDGVQRRSELMAHVGDKSRTRCIDLADLVQHQTVLLEQ